MSHSPIRPITCTGAMNTILAAPHCPPPARIVPSHWMYHLPFAFWLVGVLRPTMFVELGTWHGASFCAFCQEMDRLSLPCEAYAIDMWEGDEHMGQYGSEVLADLKEYVSTRYGSFACLLKMSFDEAIAQFQNHSIDLLHMDGCHTTEAILHDFEAWLPKLSSKGVVLVHDICTRLPGYGGVEAWQALSSRFPSFAFSHGYGLGVLLVGNNVPDALSELATSADSGKLLCAFRDQAKIYEQIFALQEKRQKEAAEAKQREQELIKTISTLQDILEKERREAAAKSSELKDAIIQEQLRVNAVTSSISWRITAPLRKLAALCRR